MSIPRSVTRIIFPQINLYVPSNIRKRPLLCKMFIMIIIIIIIIVVINITILSFLQEPPTMFSEEYQVSSKV